MDVNRRWSANAADNPDTGCIGLMRPLSEGYAMSGERKVEFRASNAYP